MRRVILLLCKRLLSHLAHCCLVPTLLFLNYGMTFGIRSFGSVCAWLPLTSVPASRPTSCTVDTSGRYIQH